MSIADTRFRRLNLDNVNRAPRKRGVYALYADRTLLYIGVAAGGRDTIRRRLRTHLGTDDKVATTYKRETTQTPEARVKALLEEHRAAHGGLPTQNAGN